MGKAISAVIVFLSLMTVNSCSVTDTEDTGKTFNVSVQVGSNLGGITENTDMSVVPGAKVPAEATVDAFSGATYPGFNAGIYLKRPLKNNIIETGLEYMYNYQSFNYIDAGNMYIGVRELHVSQLMVPVTFGIGLMKKTIPEAELLLKFGFLGQVNFVSGTGTGILPDYSILPFSAGPTIGFSVMPVRFNNGSKVGLYFDIYRGSQIYEDFYNRKSFNMPGSSFAKFGLKYQF